jgi:hypothetical protein
MPDWLYALPDAGIMGAVVAVLVCVDLLAARLRRYFASRWLPPSSSGALLDSYRLVVSLTALVLAFSLLQAEANFREVKEIVAREADTFDVAARQLQRSELPDAVESRDRLVDYGQAIVTEEWPLLVHGHRATRVNRLYAALLRSATAFEPASARQQNARNDLLRSLDLLGDLRDRRVAAATIRLPTSFWAAIGTMALICTLLAAAASTTVAHKLATLLPAAALGVLIALVVIIDAPFKGQTAVRPDELQQVLLQLAPAAGTAPADAKPAEPDAPPRR